jgi:glyoxylase-like metal-dependent hydrolase (beta-lactamase superfamily II)
MNQAAPEPPKETFSKSPYILKDATREIRFYHFGWAHTRGDGFVFLPKEKILCTGDAVVNGAYNYTADGNLANWPKVIRSAQQLGPEIILPGHGTPGGKELLDGQVQFFLELNKAVQSAIAAGKKLPDLVQDGNPAKTTVKLPDSVKRWIGPSLPSQVRDSYEEITQKKPHGDLPH